jgi:hypothetical protein
MADNASSVAVTFTSPLPSANYRVAITRAGITTTFRTGCKECEFSVASKTTAGFTIEQRNNDNGNLTVIGEGPISLDWIAIEDN